MRRSTPVKKLLLDVLDCAFDRRSWHGANLVGAIRGVSASRAARHIAGRKSIWEQLLHAAYWKRMALHFLGGDTPEPRPASNWTKPPKSPSESSWRADIALLRDIHAQLRRAVSDLSPRQLTARKVWLIHGVAAHDLYHAGQIKLLRRLLASRTRRK